MKKLSDKDYKTMTRILEAVGDGSIFDGSIRAINLQRESNLLIKKWKKYQTK